VCLSEFDLIRRWFRDCGARRDDLLLGVGDDAALLLPPPGMELATTLDTLVSGVHFFPDADPEALGHKTLAVNLSDLAAMGATPAWVTLALTLPAADPAWLTGFARGFCGLARAHGVALAGGDTTRGPLSLTVAANGWVPAGQALRRAGAAPGDGIYVTGTLGDAGLALAELGAGRMPDPALRRRLERPDPRVAAGLALRGLASAAIDLSDGLLADLGHLLAASAVGARLELACLPRSPVLAAWLAAGGDWNLPLNGGDDYELCFTVPRSRAGALTARLGGLDCGIAAIGSVTAEPGLKLLGPDGRPFVPRAGGWDHFGESGPGAA
jgi:thiamine-monophosphate kinase